VPDNTPLVRPVHTETVDANVILSAANVMPSASDGAVQQMLPWLIVALGLAGVIVGLILQTCRATATKSRGSMGQCDWRRAGQAGSRRGSGAASGKDRS